MTKSEMNRFGIRSTGADLIGIADRLWGLLARRARRGTLLGAVGGREGHVVRVWFDHHVSIATVEYFEASAAKAMALGEFQHAERIVADGKAVLQTLIGRKTSAHGKFFVSVFSTLQNSPSKDLLELLLDLWETLLFAELDAEMQQDLLQEQRAIVEHITDGLLVVDRSLTVKHMNAAAGRILTLNPSTSIGRTFGSLLDFQPIIKPILDSGEGYVDRELIIRSPTRHLHLIDTAVPIKDRSGEVVSIVNSFREIQRARRNADKLVGNHARYSFDGIVGGSESLLRAVEAARKAARGFANILLLGPSGVGKEVFAQSIHNASPRADGPFIAINCAALPRDLIESELFGYAPGSFTGATKEGRPGKFEAASGGTIFLDEISELPIDVQAKLLRVLQEREVVRVGETRGLPIDVRVISASNRNLGLMVERKEFREDLYYRIHVIAIDLPSLSERADDVVVLANHFLRKYSQILGKRVFAIDEEALARMIDYAWPGNVRELENLVERLVNMVDGKSITLADLPPHVLQGRRPVLDLSPPKLNSESTIVLTLAEVERKAIELALEACEYNVSEAARRLGVAKPTVYSKIKAYGIILRRISLGSSKSSGN